MLLLYMKYQIQESSYLLCWMAYLIRLISFLPLYSPCLRLTFETTFFHPASSLSFLYYYLNSSSFLIFSLALSCFSSSFLFKNYYSCLLPSLFLLFFYSYSFCWMNRHVRFFILIRFEFFLIISEYVESSSLPKNHWSHYPLRPFGSSLLLVRMMGKNQSSSLALANSLCFILHTHGKDGGLALRSLSTNFF